MIDPFCGMNVEPNSAAGSHVHNGQTYYFCSQHCLAKFKEDPEKFLNRPRRNTLCMVTNNHTQIQRRHQSQMEGSMAFMSVRWIPR